MKSEAEPRRLRVLRLCALLTGLLAILAWQWGFARHGSELRADDGYHFSASSGTHEASRFVYFYYYLGLYPVAIKDRVPAARRVPQLPYSESGAQLVLRTHGQQLGMDIGWTFRAGERGKLFPYLFDAWLKGKPERPSLVPFQRALFVIALGSVFAAFWHMRLGWLGAWLVIFVGSHPTQLQSVHLGTDVFGLHISLALLLLALHLPLLQRQRTGSTPWHIPVVTGILTASIGTIRTEPVAMGLAAMAAYLGMSRLPWVRRWGLVGVLVAAHVATGAAWDHWFRTRFEQASEIVAAVGGDPYTGPYETHHQVWHPIWCGLGDFDEKYGYRWDDRAAYNYALPVLEEEYGIDVPDRSPQSHFFRDTHWGASRYYKKFPHEMPHYHEVIRNKVVSDISRDPGWYIEILARRTWRLLTQTTPLRVRGWTGAIELPSNGIVYLALLGYLIVKRRSFYVRLALFTLPTCLTALLIYSGRGTTYYAIYHLVGAAIILQLALEALARRRRGRSPAGDRWRGLHST